MISHELVTNYNICIMCKVDQLSLMTLTLSLSTPLYQHTDHGVGKGFFGEDGEICYIDKI